MPMGMRHPAPPRPAALRAGDVVHLRLNGFGWDKTDVRVSGESRGDLAAFQENS